MSTKHPLICPPKTRLPARPLLKGKQAAGLETLFKVLGNQTRLRLLHALVRKDKLCVSELAETLGMKVQAVSNQFQRLVGRGIVSAERSGTNIYYRIVDPCVVSLLDKAICLVEDAQRRKR